MKTFYLDKPDVHYRRIVNKAFPSYKGRSFELTTVGSDHTFDLDSSWSGGTRSLYNLVSLIGTENPWNKVFPIGDRNPIQFGGKRHTFTLPENVVLVEHSIFCGKDHGITVWVRTDNSSNLLPKTTSDLTWAHKVVLVSTGTYKNTYAGKTNVRFLEANETVGISEEAWETAKSELIEQGLLRSNGSITPDGRNAVTGTHDLYQLKGGE